MPGIYWLILPSQRTRPSLLNARDLDTLASLLTAPYTKREIEDIRCFLPHHGILIYRKPDAHTLIFALAAGIL